MSAEVERQIAELARRESERQARMARMENALEILVDFQADRRLSVRQIIIGVHAVAREGLGRGYDA